MAWRNEKPMKKRRKPGGEIMATENGVAGGIAGMAREIPANLAAITGVS